jgi:hypothetical protein
MIVLFALWCAFCWRLRGGLISNLTSKVWRPLTTGETRIACALLMAAPLALVDPWMLATIPAFFAAMTLGYFDRSMGLEQPGRDHVFLALWGVAVAAIMIAPAVALHFDATRIMPAGLGVLVAAAYAANKPFGGKWTERAELATGAIFGIIMAMAYGG